MLVSHHKEKLIEAISFFAKSTKYCGTLKLFKLLYWLDYHHFRETGKSVTGLEYFAFPMGPVPTSLYEQFERKSGEIVDHFVVTPYKRVGNASPLRTIDDDDESFVVKEKEIHFIPTTIKPKKPYKHRYLTKREMRIAEQLAEIFKTARAEDISDISHVRGGPWHKALKTTGPKSRIDFLSSLVPMRDGDYLDEEELRERISDHEEILRNLA